ncbi:MAG TPA: hypothetical protein VLT47_12220 [Anaeromyxobacteraceae bacterium]|nr:hypothetical protein [Anaeromyxobacteraceae bacterium]
MRDSERLGALDLTRFFAISMMFVCHWVGILERFPGPHADAILWLGRSATPGFVTVFGFTSGYAFWSRYRSDPGALGASLLARAVRTAKYALLVSAPAMGVLAHDGVWSASRWAFATYSVLVFYCLAIPSMYLVFWLVRRRPSLLAPLLGAASWAAGDLLRSVWGPSESIGIEYARLVLVAGPYAYLNLMGVAVTMIPLGIFLRTRAEERRTATLGALALVGAALCAAGLLSGALSDGFSARAVINGEAKYPPKLWYFTHYAGMTLFLLGALGVAQRRFPRFSTWVQPLATLGGAPLKIYAAHAFVLPATHLLAWATKTRTEVTFAIALGLLLVYFARLSRPPDGPTPKCHPVPRLPSV